MASWFSPACAPCCELSPIVSNCLLLTLADFDEQPQITERSQSLESEQDVFSVAPCFNDFLSSRDGYQPILPGLVISKLVLPVVFTLPLI